MFKREKISWSCWFYTKIVILEKSLIIIYHLNRLKVTNQIIHKYMQKNHLIKLYANSQLTNKTQPTQTKKIPSLNEKYQ